MTDRSALSLLIMIGFMIVLTLACATVLRNRTWRDPVTIWLDVVTKNPDELNVYISLGNAYLDSGMHREALSVFQYVQAREATTSIRIYPNIGNVYIAMKRYEQAEELFSRVLMINADDELSYVGRGKARFAQGRYDAALRDFQEALRRNPSQARYYYYRGETRFRLQHSEQARADLARSCQLGWEEACDRLQEVVAETKDYSGAASIDRKALGRRP